VREQQSLFNAAVVLIEDVRPDRGIRFAVDFSLEGDGFELVWGFSCQEVGFGL
jgi:hypothetical protein